MTQVWTEVDREADGAYPFSGWVRREIRRLLLAAGVCSICVVLTSCSNPSDQALSRAGLNPGRLRGVVAPGVDLSGLNLVGKDFSNADLHGADLRGCDLRRTNFSRANLRNVRLDPIPAEKLRRSLFPEEHRGQYYISNLSDANLSFVDLSGANLHSTYSLHSNFRSANLRGARGKEVIMEFYSFIGPLFYECDLSGADLRNLEGGIFRSCNLTDADLRGSRFPKGTFFDSNLRGARLEGADFSATMFMSQAHLQGAYYDSRTKWSDDVDTEQDGLIRSDAGLKKSGAGDAVAR